MGVRVDLNVSLDGYATTEGGTPDNPFGEDWNKLTAAYVATRTFRERVLHDTSGEGTTGIDDRYAAAYFEHVGAEIMGAGMFGFHTFPDDPDWKGWWGDEPPFRVPVFVLTHRTRARSTWPVARHSISSMRLPLRCSLRPPLPPVGKTFESGAASAPCESSSKPASLTNCTSLSRPSFSVAESICGATFVGSRTAVRS